ncbi:MAG: SusE domain-containing protein [Ferruginibacter sp.]
MKNIFKLLLLATGILFIYSSCKKVEDLPFYSNGAAPVLSASATAIAPVTADSNKAVVTFSWTSPQYATDSSKQKFIVEIDSAGRNFAKEVTFVVNGNLSKTFLAKELNTILLGFGFAYNKPYDVDVRITSSYANNNEQYQSNTIKLNMTAYLIPPKVVPPSTNKLFLVGNATAGGWNNAVPAPAQEFTRIDSVTYEGTFYLNGGGQYVFLPLNGNWDHKFNVADANAPGLVNGGTFGADQGNANIPGPASTGIYTIHIDFQRGLFTVTKVKQYGLLYVPGDYQGWKPETAPALGSPADDGKFDGYIYVPAGGTNEFKFTTTPDWNNAIGGAAGGVLVPGGGGNLTVPGEGYYHIEANTVDNKWTATKTTWGLIGSFAASNWNADVPMTYSATDNKWTGTITTVAGDQFKFRANGGWALNYGDSNGKGSLTAGGENIGDASKNFAVPAGTHTIILYLNNAGYYTYSIQ